MKTIETFESRLAKGLDPLTGEPMQTKGAITRKNGKCVDETGREVTLNANCTWVYKH
jgi:hypothetical protein